MNRAQRSILGLVACLALLSQAEGADDAKVKVGQKLDRQGDEIVVCGQFFHTTTPVVLWTDPGGYDAYRVERRFAPMTESSWDATKKAGAQIESPNRFGLRKAASLTPNTIEQVRGGGWSVKELQGVVDQFVIHFDACGTSKQCFDVLHDRRGLSVHFMLDLDGTIYQTLDLKERAWHATIANTRSIGIEIANIGAYPVKGGTTDNDPAVLSKWYAKGQDGKTILTIPGGAASAGERNPSLTLRPARDEIIVGEIQGTPLSQYDLTPQQYDSLIKLTATLCTVFPKIKCDYPRDSSGKLLTRQLAPNAYGPYEGVLGHYHVQSNKVDPGPAFQWDKVIDGARELMKP